MLAMLTPSEESPQPVLVAAVAGLAGVGKTELVVQAATRALKQPGSFPGGVLFIDMFGYDSARQMSPERALRDLLRALGISGEVIPAELQGRSRLYRSVLATYAEQNRRILVIIDNVSSAEQARPLLPTDGATRVLLTSRHTLDLGARLHDLDILSEHASVELLRHVLLQARGPADTRIEDSPEDAATIARLCGELPLALRIAAALLADTPTRSLASLVQALRHTRLDRLRREDQAVRAAFDLSYQRLSNDHARLFRLLSLYQGPEPSTESAAHLADTDHVHAEEVLQDLARAHLIEPGHTWGRWRLHDLVRLYASELGHQHADADHRTAAQLRLHQHFVRTARAARSAMAIEPRTPLRERRSPDFRSFGEAEEWFADECSNLLSLITADPEHSRTPTAAWIAAFLAPYLRFQYRHADLLKVSSTIQNLAHERSIPPLLSGVTLLMISYEMDRIDLTVEAVDLLLDSVGFLCEGGRRNLEVIAIEEIKHHLLKIIRRWVLPEEQALKLDWLTLTHAHVVDPEHKESSSRCWCRQCWLQYIAVARR
ncbi:hypothetical protein BJF83_24925 [Nocardiopsis sp. CNR-923]|nr:hypothetical protein BJF83_24925 [Nocardiopsis sp. CNR-923]